MSEGSDRSYDLCLIVDIGRRVSLEGKRSVEWLRASVGAEAALAFAVGGEEKLGGIGESGRTEGIRGEERREEGWRRSPTTGVGHPGELYSRHTHRTPHAHGSLPNRVPTSGRKCYLFFAVDVGTGGIWRLRLIRLPQDVKEREETRRNFGSDRRN